MPDHPALRALDLLDRSSKEFDRHLREVLYGEEYGNWVPNIQTERGDVTWLIDYLAEVRFHVATPALLLNYRRFSRCRVLIPPVTGSVYAIFATYVPK